MFYVELKVNGKRVLIDFNGKKRQYRLYIDKTSGRPDAIFVRKRGEAILEFLRLTGIIDKQNA